MNFDDECLRTLRLVGDNTKQGRFLVDEGSRAEHQRGHNMRLRLAVFSFLEFFAAMTAINGLGYLRQPIFKFSNSQIVQSSKSSSAIFNSFSVFRSFWVWARLIPFSKRAFAFSLSPILELSNPAW